MEPEKPGARYRQSGVSSASRAMNLDRQPGSYILILACDKSEEASIGKRLSMTIEPGYYCYVGSALGPGGLAARLGHHTRPVVRPHWHIDYLRSYTRLIEIWYGYGRQHRECDWTHILQSIGELYVPIKGFGATDCTCSSHLMYSSTRPDVEQFKHIVMKQITGLADIKCINMESGEDGNG